MLICSNVRGTSEAILSCKFDRTIRCVVITGAGEKAFCAGADLKERQNGTGSDTEDCFLDSWEYE